MFASVNTHVCRRWDVLSKLFSCYQKPEQRIVIASCTWGKVGVRLCKLRNMQFKRCKCIIDICSDIIVLSISNANIIIFNKSFYISRRCLHPVLMIFLTDHTDFLIFIHLVLKSGISIHFLDNVLMHHFRLVVHNAMFLPFSEEKKLW